MQRDILSYVKFYKYPDFIKGKFYYLDRDSIDHRFSYMDIPEIVASHPDKKEQIFFQYDLENKSGHYLYPCNKDKEIKILLKNLAISDKILELRPMIDYYKKLKTIHSIASFMEWENYLDNQIAITGDQLEPFIRTKGTLSISEYFIKTLRTRTSDILTMPIKY
ncbi:hypothetical protein [Shimazuella kribbensis]|uniref:hypothetical protein n=1 Tax=Shimazuella kribbensis TaxID=139808 RepID=UPI000491C30C|nr:hypothetical protein [Shimazuella kribbensis]